MKLATVGAGKNWYFWWSKRINGWAKYNGLELKLS